MNRVAVLLALSAGLVAVLGAGFARVLHRLRVANAVLTRAASETARILDTVGEGLLLLDRNHSLAETSSRALLPLLGRRQLTGINFDTLLASMVDEPTRRLAIDYLSLLWRERVNENLVRSLNPLTEVEIERTGPDGAPERRVLCLEFRRVRSASRTTALLCTVSDVTDRVRRVRELATAHTEAQSLFERLVALLEVGPDDLAAFLTHSETALQLVNGVLKRPARDAAAFREKLERIFAEIHPLKTQASALRLRAVETSAQQIEAALAELGGRSSLTGNDFLPLAVKLDGFFAELAVLRDLGGRLQGARARLVEPEPTESTVVIRGLAPPATLHATLQRLAEDLAAEYDRSVSLVSVGLEQAPDAYTALLHIVLKQLVRNAVVHGIESAAERTLAGKSSMGTLTVEFVDRGGPDLELTFQDDGRGLDRQLAGNLFKPQAGRGTGMPVIRDLVAEVGGRISLASRRGQFTRLRIHLPAVRSAAA